MPSSLGVHYRLGVACRASWSQISVLQVMVVLDKLGAEHSSPWTTTRSGRVNWRCDPRPLGRTPVERSPER